MHNTQITNPLNQTIMQNPNSLPLFTALGIAAYHGCINPQDLLNARPDEGWPSLSETEHKFFDQYQNHIIHVFYCQRDEQVFALEQDPIVALWDYGIDPEGTKPPYNNDLTEDQLWAEFLALNDQYNAWFDYTDPETKITHHILCILDI